MENLGAKEAADRIRDVFHSDRSMRTDPEQAHQMKFVKDVVKELGGDESPETLHHVGQLLREHGVALHAGHEYPKYATRKWDRTAKIVQNEQEEQDWVNEEQPVPVENDQSPLRTLDAPVQDQSLDLKDRVPHTVPTEHPAGRAPDEQTNRAASQQPEPEPVVEVDDDDVHVEEVGESDPKPVGNRRPM